MKNAVISLFVGTFLCVGTFTSCRQESMSVKPAKVDLLSTFWKFDSSCSPQSSLSSLNVQERLPGFDNLKEGFTIRFAADLNPGKEQRLLEIPYVVNVAVKHYCQEKGSNQNYSPYKMPDGTVSVLEAALKLQQPEDTTKFQDLIIGVPLAMLPKPEGVHQVTLQFTGVQWSLYVDGRLYDNDFALGYPSSCLMQSWRLVSETVSDAALYIPAIKAERDSEKRDVAKPDIQYWTPPYHNAWVGDVATFFHNGRYHVFYLFDRRGHASKFGKGGHYFEHLSTVDFKTWTEHEAATPIEEQWETFGTGTPFLYDGKLCLSYGLHTTRIYPKEKTTLPMLWEYLDKHGYTGSVNYDTVQSVVPAGSTYSISEDGVSNFKKTHILYHPCENPSIYTDPKGDLKMLANYGARGTWGADSVNGGWKCLNDTFPLGGDCTFFFRWGNYDYIIGGFTRLWNKKADAPDTSYKDMVAQGQDFYNGLSVPAITGISDNRYLIAGWMKMQNWGGALVIHELVQDSDGYVGTKWMNEIVPLTEPEKVLSKELKKDGAFPCDDGSFMLTFDVVPESDREGKMGVTFVPEDSLSKGCEWQILLNEQRAQYSNSVVSGYATAEKTLREGGNPQSAANYAIENGFDTTQPFKVRMLVKATDKFGGTVIDTEIGGRRTMLTYRPGLFVKNIRFQTEGVKIKNITVASLQEE